MKILEIGFQIAELISAILGTYYIVKYQVDKPTRYFVLFLWLTVIVEIFGMTMPKLIDLGYLSSIRNSWLRKNYWLLNIYAIINFIFYILYFQYYLESKKRKLILSVLSKVFFVTAAINLLISGVFFDAVSAYSFMLGAILIFLSVFFYFFEILQSNEILNFKSSLPFYVGIGTLLFHLSVTPLFIYSNYFHEDKSLDFVYIYRVILRSAIILLYTCYSIGFIVCSKKKMSY